MIKLSITAIDSPSPGAVTVTDHVACFEQRVLLAVDSMPWALDRDQPFPDDYADFTPLGECPKHGLEPHQAACREVSTGAGDVCLASIFACGDIDLNSIF
jgi:hypothetical protein